MVTPGWAAPYGNRGVPAIRGQVHPPLTHWQDLYQGHGDLPQGRRGTWTLFTLLVAEDDAAADDSDDNHDGYHDDDDDDNNYNDSLNDDYVSDDDDDDYNDYYNDDYVSAANGIGRYNFRFLIPMSNLGQ